MNNVFQTKSYDFQIIPVLEKGVRRKDADVTDRSNGEVRLSVALSSIISLKNSFL